MSQRALLAAAVGLLAGASTLVAEAPARRLVLVSIDGLSPSAYTATGETGFAIPNLRRLAREGAFASGVEGVMPAVTYPSHTTLLTGVPPAVHGIFANTFVDPLGLSNDAWRWYAREIRVPTLVSAVRARGGSVGSVSWPVSVGMDADFLVPELWRSGSEHPSDLELLRALSTPGLIDAAASARGRPFGWPASDVDRTDLALAILRIHRPTLLLLHLFELDKHAHARGPFSAEARATLEASDRELGRILGALDELGLAGSTLVAVVSDHGFREATKVVRPNALLVEAGLLELDEKGKVRSWKAWFLSHGGSASLHLADPEDEGTPRKIRALLAAKLAEPGSGLAALVERPELDRRGSEPGAALVIEAAEGFAISRTPTGGWLGDAVDRGYHGYDPRRPAMRAAFVAAGPGLAKLGDLGVVPMTAIGPTLAAYLGVDLGREAVAPLPLFAAAAAP